MKAVRSLPDVVPPPNRTLGWAVLDWTAQWLLQPDGPDAGSPFEFTREQARIILRWYAIDERGRFIYRRGVLRRMKGWGKNPLLDVIAAVELCGPCRFGGWNRDGTPIAICHPVPWVQIAAVTQDQTRNSMGLFASLFSDEAISVFGIDVLKTVVYANHNAAQIESVTSSPRALEGSRTTLVVLDESQHWLANNDGHAMAEAIARNQAKSRDGASRTLEITNAHLPGEGSVAELTYEAWRAAAGNVPGLYYDSLEAPAIEDLADEDELRTALMLARGDSIWLDVDRLTAEIQDPTTSPGMARRFYLNQVVAVGAEKWIDPANWDACALEREIPQYAPVVLALDGSFNNDSTAVVACLVDDVPHLEVVGLWQPANADDEVDIFDVEEAIRDAALHWTVLEVAADPYRWARSLQILYDEGIPVVNFPQSAARMSPATARFGSAVATKALTHSGDPRLRAHVLNSVCVNDNRGRRIQKDSKKSPRKIDLAVAGLMAHDRAVSSEAAQKELERQHKRKRYAG